MDCARVRLSNLAVASRRLHVGRRLGLEKYRMAALQGRDAGTRPARATSEPRLAAPANLMNRSVPDCLVDNCEGLIAGLTLPGQTTAMSWPQPRQAAPT